MWWFKTRPKHRRPVRRELKFSVEHLESREVAGNVWLPGSSIDITGLTWDSRFFVAGEIVELAISGSGEDWDVRVDELTQTGYTEQDSVLITWSGASCEVLDGGERALCTLGAPGEYGNYDITLFADDTAVTQAGDTGSRDDAAIQYTANLTAIWVGIHLGFSTKHPKDDLEFAPPFDGFTGVNTNGNLVFTDPNSGETDGYRWKTELIGTVSPIVPDGTGPFTWKQEKDRVLCMQLKDGSWTPSIESGPDGPTTNAQQRFTVNSNVFMIDAPGKLTNAFGNLWDKFYYYSNFKTAVYYGGDPGTKASDDFRWHVVLKLSWSATNGVWTYESGDRSAGTTSLPPQDCSSRP